ncbi:MAG: DUF58 domain-containing protein [Thermoguttaceae bacterium]
MSEKNYFHPETLRKITRLDLRARHVVDGFLGGQHQSRHFGNSVEFRQHRQYVPGDDPRSVDWKVWAKQDRYYVKQYEIDTNLRLNLLLDTSESMRFGTGHLNKYDYAATIAASLSYLAIRQQDAVGLIAFDKSMQTALPPKMKHSQIAALMTRMTQIAPKSGKSTEYQKDGTKEELKTIYQESGDQPPQLALNELLNNIKKSQPTMEAAMREAANSVKKHGLIVLLSDLFVQREGLFQGLRFLQSHGHDVLVLHIMDDAELDFRFSGPTRFHGLEVPVQLRCDPRMLRANYLESLHDYLQEIKNGCAKLGIDYALFRTSTPIDAALTSYLCRRRHFLKKR